LIAYLLIARFDVNLNNKRRLLLLLSQQCVANIRKIGWCTYRSYSKPKEWRFGTCYICICPYTAHEFSVCENTPLS